MSLDEAPIVTFADGCDLNRTENVAREPDSVVTRPVVGVTVMPATARSGARQAESIHEA